MTHIAGLILVSGFTGHLFDAAVRSRLTKAYNAHLAHQPQLSTISTHNHTSYVHYAGETHGR